MNKLSIMRLIAVSVLTVILFGGCASKILLPYEECPECVKGKGEGYCGSVSDVYKATKDLK